MPLHTLFPALRRAIEIAPLCAVIIICCSLIFATTPRSSAQMLSSSGTFSWQTSATWGVASGVPGSSPESTTAIVRLTSASVTLLNATPPFAVSTLHILHAMPENITTGTLENITLGTLTLRPTLPSSTTINTTTLTVGQIRFSTFGAVLVIGAGLRVILQGDIITLTSATNTTLNTSSNLASTPPRIFLERNATLELVGTSANTLSNVDIRGSGANSTIILRNGFNGGVVPSANFSSNTQPLQARLMLGGAFTLGGDLSISTNGTFDFGSTGANKLTLGGFNATVHGTLLNGGNTRYFVTNGAGFAGLNGVSNTTFPVGPTSALYTPMNLVNNAAPSLFSVRAVTPLSPITAPLAAASSTSVQQGTIDVRWNVIQNNKVAQGLAIVLTPQWPTSQEAGGFNRALAVVNRYASNILAQSSTPAAAFAAVGLTNYFQSSLVVSQTAIPGLLTSSTDIVVTSQPQPTILSFSPTAAASSQTVTIVGQRFVNVTAVRFGGFNAASFTVNAAGDTIRAVVGQGATGLLTVVQTGGTAQTSGITIISSPPQTPIIRDARPQPISAGLGDVQVTITGTGFGSNTVRVVAAGSGAQGTITPSSNSATEIRFTLPGQFSRNVGSVTLTVTSLDKNPISTNVTVAVPPATTITSITPSSTSGNLRAHTILVTGTAFGPQSTFSLNGTSLRLMSFVTNTNGSLTAGVEIPIGAVSGNIVVTNLNTSTAQFPFSITGVTLVVIAPGGEHDVIISPNPATDNISIHAILRSSAHITLYVRDVLGREVLREEVWLGAGVLRREMDISRLASGVYSVEVRENGQLRGVRRFVKQ